MHLMFLLQTGPLIVGLMHADYESQRQVGWVAAVETIAEFLYVCLDSCTHGRISISTNATIPELALASCTSLSYFEHVLASLRNSLQHELLVDGPFATKGIL